MEWNKYHESLLQKWAQTSKTYSIMHSLSAQYYSKWDKRLGIPLILLGAGTTSSIFSSEGSDTMTFVNGGLALSMTALIGLSKFLGFSELQVKHQTASFKYISIAMKVDTMLSFPRLERDKTPLVFLDKIKNLILEIRENTPEVRSDILKDYIQKLDKTITNTRSNVYYDVSTECDKLAINERGDNREAVLHVSEMLRGDDIDDDMTPVSTVTPSSPNLNITNERIWG
jgi:hypothetical protein